MISDDDKKKEKVQNAVFLKIKQLEILTNELCIFRPSKTSSMAKKDQTIKIRPVHGPGMSCNYSLTERTTWVVTVQEQSLTFET